MSRFFLYTVGVLFAFIVFFSGCISGPGVYGNASTTTPQGNATNPEIKNASIEITQNPSLGAIITDGDGMTLYVFTKDVQGKSNCYAQCEAAWPPLFVTGSVTSSDLSQEDLGVTLRQDGRTQATFKGMPLYYFAQDKKPGDIAGEGYGKVWYALVLPSDKAIPPEAAQYSKDWPLPNKDYSNTRATKDSSINSGNVKDLGVGWSFPIPGVGAYGGAASTPLILGNTVYFQDLKANVFALDLQNGKAKWSKMYDISAVVGPNGPAVAYGKVFVAKDLYSMVALDINSGEELWSTKLSDVKTTGIDIQPTAYDGLIYTSTVPGTADIFYAPGGIGVIYALDQKDGSVKWNFSTVDSPDLWGHPEVNSGGGCWYTPSIDLATGIMYWGIANPAPFPGTEQWPSGSSRPGPNLYTDSMMALEHRTGMMSWYKQVLQHDLFDYDFQIAPILASAKINGKQQDIVIGAGKMGRVYAFNRGTGEILWSANVGEHNGNDQLDRLPPGTTKVIPSALGGVETPMAYSDGIVYVPVVDLPMDWTPTKLDFSSVNFSSSKGELAAIDASTGKTLWNKVFDSLNVGGATVVNDLVFTATYGGNIYAFKKDTGEQLFQYKAPAGINAWPAVAGDTIIWPAGVGGTPMLVALKIGAKDVPASSPALAIIKPNKGSTILAGDIETAVKVSNFNLVHKPGDANVKGEGHLIYYLDVEPPTDPLLPAFTSTGTYGADYGTSHIWMGVAPGAHTFAVQLVNNDHTPLRPPVIARASFNTIAYNYGEGAGGETAKITLTAKNRAFDRKQIIVPAGALVTIVFNNQDEGIQHNFAVYEDKEATKLVFRGGLITGVSTTTYKFAAPMKTGTYFFQCDPHSKIMNGEFIVQISGGSI